MIKNKLKFIKSLSYAIKGIQDGLTQRNIKIQLTCGLIAILAGIYFNISSYQWLIIILCIFMVLTAELLNSAIEETCNSLRDHFGASYDSTRKARDIAAGAVLTLSIGTLIIGLIIFLPKIFGL